VSTQSPFKDTLSTTNASFPPVVPVIALKVITGVALLKGAIIET